MKQNHPLNMTRNPSAALTLNCRVATGWQCLKFAFQASFTNSRVLLYHFLWKSSLLLIMNIIINRSINIDTDVFHLPLYFYSWTGGGRAAVHPASLTDNLGFYSLGRQWWETVSLLSAAESLMWTTGVGLQWQTLGGEWRLPLTDQPQTKSVFLVIGESLDQKTL